jgi:predicted DNA-binding transcriptional regulator YafY
LDTTERKILAAIPTRLRSVLSHAAEIIGFEQLPQDIFHPEPEASQTTAAGVTQSKGGTTPLTDEGETVSAFLRTVLDSKLALISYRSPYSGKVSEWKVHPLGLFWDRGHWYLVGRQTDTDGSRGLPRSHASVGLPEPSTRRKGEHRNDLAPTSQAAGTRILRADRVVAIRPSNVVGAAHEPPPQGDFDLRKLLERAWLKEAIIEWKQRAPVTLRISPAQAERLRQDWYYRYADFVPLPNGSILMKFGENDPKNVLALLRWLGPGAELIEPETWRGLVREELQQMLDLYRPALGQSS